MFWIGALAFSSRLLDCEHPVDVGGTFVSSLFPGGDFGFEDVSARFRYWPRRTPISISTMLSQLACFGVKWNSRRRRMRRASDAGSAL